MERGDAYKVVADLLRLRQWAVRGLSSGQAESASVAGVTEETWRHFVALERCASSLLERISIGGLAPAVQNVLRSAAAREAQSALTARAEGREIAKIADAAGFPVVVLKGGVDAIAGKKPALPLADLDLLVERHHVKTMVDRLVAAGFGRPARELAHHQGITPSSDRLAVEVHWTTHDDGRPLDPVLWNRLEPVSEAAPLKRLGPQDHLLHLIEHAIVVHRDRSVSLRDTILIGGAAKGCSREDLGVVRSKLDASMTSLLDFAIVIAEGRPVVDPFIESCATFYSAVILAPELPRPLSSNGALAFVREIELGRIPPIKAITNSLRWRGTGNRTLAAVADRIPLIGTVVLAPAHLAYYSIVAAFMLPSIRATRDRALRELDPKTL